MDFPSIVRWVGGRQAPLTFGGAEVLAGGGEASGPVHIDGRHAELVPSAGPDVRQLHPLVRGLRGKRHTEACYPDVPAASAL